VIKFEMARLRNQKLVENMTLQRMRKDEAEKWGQKNEGARFSAILI